MLYVLVDSGVSTVVYLMQNRVFPTKYALHSESVKEITPYLTNKDAVVVIMQGLTNWSLLQASNLISDLDVCKDRVGLLRIYSTCELPIKQPYTLVSGDLFYGSFVDISDKKRSKPYNSDIAKLLTDYTKELEPTCLDIDDGDLDIDIVPQFAKEDNALLNRLIAVDISKK